MSWDNPRVIWWRRLQYVYVQAAVETVKNVEQKSYSYYGKDTLQINNVFTQKVVQRVTSRRETKSTATSESFEIYNLSITLVLLMLIWERG